MMMKQAYDHLVEFGSEVPSWVTSMRKPAWTVFQENGLPNRRHEDWKYTSLRNLAGMDLKWSHARGLVDGPVVRSFLGDNEWSVVLIDGAFDSSFSKLSGLPEGVEIKPLNKAFEENPEDVKKALEPSDGKDQGPFELLNQAFLHSGVFISLAKNVRLEKPIHIVFVNTAKPHEYSIFPRVVVNLAQGAEATLMESHQGLEGATYLHSGVAKIHVNAGARLSHYKIQTESQKAYHMQSISVCLERDAHYGSFVLGLGAQLARTEFDVAIEGQGADLLLDGLFMVDGNRQIDSFSHIDHKVANCQSSQTYKGVATGQGRGVFCGKIKVHQGAKQTNAAQLSNSLLLSKEAEVDCKPILEIDDDDVKCSHGATIGQLKEDEIFYLQSRGINRPDAVSLLTRAFAMELVTKVQKSSFARRASHEIEKWVAKI